MHAQESDALAHQVADDFQMIVLNDRMPAAAIHEEQNRVSAVERVGVLWPAVQIKRGFHARHVLQASVKQLHAGVEFVFARAVARPAGNQNDFLVRGARVDAPAKRRRQQGQEGGFHAMRALSNYCDLRL